MYALDRLKNPCAYQHLRDAASILTVYHPSLRLKTLDSPIFMFIPLACLVAYLSYKYVYVS